VSNDDSNPRDPRLDFFTYMCSRFLDDVHSLSGTENFTTFDMTSVFNIIEERLKGIRLLLWTAR
jgi:hypothetical protein